MNLKTRVKKLERATGPADLSKLSDAELEQLISGGDPKQAGIWDAMADTELEQMAAMTNDQAEAFFQQMAVKYGNA